MKFSDYEDPDMDMGSEPDADTDDQQAKKSAMQSLSKHIGADSGGSEDDEEGGSTEEVDADPESEGAVPMLKLRKSKKKGGGGGGGMGGMGGGMGGMDIGSMMGGAGGGAGAAM